MINCEQKGKCCSFSKLLLLFENERLLPPPTPKNPPPTPTTTYTKGVWEGIFGQYLNRGEETLPGRQKEEEEKEEEIGQQEKISSPPPPYEFLEREPFCPLLPFFLLFFLTGYTVLLLYVYYGEEGRMRQGLFSNLTCAPPHLKPYQT